MSTTERNYRGKDVDMLMAVSIIVENAIRNKAFLQSKRSTWADPFFENVKASIDTTVETHLGVDSARDLRQSTQVVLGIQANALADLSEFKIQVQEDFKSDRARRTQIFTELGFTTYHRQAQNGDQEGLINLLFQFKTNMTNALKTEISNKGTAVALIDNITGYSDMLRNADINQEVFKGIRKTLTAAALRDFNTVYESVISIAKIASRFYKGQPAMQDQFSYNKVRKTINSQQF